MNLRARDNIEELQLEIQRTYASLIEQEIRVSERRVAMLDKQSKEILAALDELKAYRTDDPDYGENRL